MTAIRRVTEIPGPKSRAMLERRATAVTRGARPLHRRRGRSRGGRAGPRRRRQHADRSGRRHRHARGRPLPAERRRGDPAAGARSCIHLCALVATYEPYVELCELLNEVTPGTFPKKTLLANSGAEAVENAVKIARAFTKRDGRAVLRGRLPRPHAADAQPDQQVRRCSSRASDRSRRRSTGSPRPSCTAGRPGCRSEALRRLRACAQLERALIAQIDPAALAAIIIEPVQGEGGFIPMPPRFLQRIRELCTQHGIVMIADEVQTGFGRTGTLFAIEHSGSCPISSRWPSRSAPACRSARRPAAPRSWMRRTSAASAAPTAAARSRASPRSRRSSSSATPAFLAHARRIGEHHARRARELEGEVAS